MCAPGQNVGPISDAIENLKRGADICRQAWPDARDRVQFAARRAQQHRAAARAILNGAGRYNAGMLLDAYHMERSGAGGRGFEGVAPDGDCGIPVQRRAARAGRGRREAADRSPAAGPRYRSLARRVQAAQGKKLRRLSELRSTESRAMGAPAGRGMPRRGRGNPRADSEGSRLKSVRNGFSASNANSPEPVWPGAAAFTLSWLHAYCCEPP